MIKLVGSIALALVCLAPGMGQSRNSRSNKPSAGSEMKESGSEVKSAGKTLGHNMKHARVARGGKGFGKHVGRAGRHFGKGVKKGVKSGAKKVAS